MAFIYDLLDTWNNAGTVFSGIKLNVTNTASAAGSKLIDLQIGGSTFFNVDKSGQVALLAGTAAAPTLIPTGDTNTGMWFPAADTIAWSTGGSERLRIDSSGRVGVGTSSPNARLEVVSTIADVFARSNSSSLTSYLGALRNDYFSGPSYAATYLMQSGADRTGTTFGISNANLGILSFQNVANGVIGTNGNAPLIFATLSLERMRILGSGNVGIGTSAPDALLSVNGVASFGVGAVATPSLAAFGDLNTGMWFPAADTIAWSTGGSERMRITSSGSVGIGTSNPAAKLDVVSGAGTDNLIRSVAGNAAYMILQGTSFYNFNAVQSYDSSSNLQWAVGGNGSANTLAFLTNGANERMRIDSSGNVGIGATSFGTSAAKVLGLGNATAPSTGPADTLQIYSSDLSAGNTMLSLYTEGTVVNANTTAAATHRIAIRVNGTVYYLLANTSA